MPGSVDDAGVKFNAAPLQICTVNDADGVVITGDGLTVAVTSTVEPEHPLAVGVIL